MVVVVLMIVVIFMLVLKTINYKRILKRIGITLIFLYLLVCLLAYLAQESLLFHPDTYDKSYKYEFEANFEEINLKMKDGTTVNSLLFKSPESKGCVFYLHGNAGSLVRWGNIHDVYTSLGFDLFITDYRGFGKSEGEIKGEELFYSDMEELYSFIKTKYLNKPIVIVGYSIGTGPAAMLASKFKPDYLILKAPYYNLTDRVQDQYPFLPGFLLKYKFHTNEFLPIVKCPITIFHGTDDRMIYYGSSEKLKQHFKSQDTLVSIPGFGHNGMNDNEVYRKQLEIILSKL